MVQLRVEHHALADYTVVTVEGILDLSTVPVFQDHLDRALREHRGGRVAVDLDGVVAMDEIALGPLLTATARSRGEGGELIVVVSVPEHRERLARIGLDRLVTVVDRLSAPDPARRHRARSTGPASATTDPSIEQVPPVIYHLALVTEWQQAQAAGRYEQSTRGRSLADEGFIHCACRDQLDGVANRFYADCTELMLLTIAVDRLTDPVRLEPPADDHPERFPHLYGPLPLQAVEQAERRRRSPDTPWRLR